MKVLILLWSSVLTIMAAPSITLKPVTYAGLRIALATDPIVQPIVTPAIAGRPDLVPLLPYSVVLINNTTHIIRAYTLRLTFVDATGKTRARNRQFFNLEAASNGMEISPGANRLVTVLASLTAENSSRSRSFVGAGSPSEANELYSLLQSQTSAVVAVDLIVFDSGQVIGPDEGRTLTYLQAYIAGESETASLLRTALNKGDGLGAITNQLNGILTDQTQRNDFASLARASQTRHFLRFSASREALQTEVTRVLAKPVFQLFR